MRATPIPRSGPYLWGRRDLNSHGLLHVILSHARLPIPTLPHPGSIILSTAHFGK